MATPTDTARAVQRRTSLERLPGDLLHRLRDLFRRKPRLRRCRARLVGSLTAEEVARAIVGRAIEREQSLVILPRRLRFLIAQARIFARLSERIVRATGRKRSLGRRTKQN